MGCESDGERIEVESWRRNDDCLEPFSTVHEATLFADAEKSTTSPQIGMGK
jgi:hypothetical protein